MGNSSSKPNARTPRLTIITVTFNNESGLRATLESARSQTFRDFQHVIVDGGSTDGTLTLVEEFAHLIDKFIHGPDKGIYDAMNKGINAANGDWLLFLNGGDKLASPRALENAFCAIDPFQDLDVALFGYHNGQRDVDALSFSVLSVAYGMPTSHQAIMFRNCEVSYDSNFKLAGDYELLCRLCEKQVRSHTFEVTLATVEPNGVSHHFAHDYNLEVLAAGKGRINPFLLHFFFFIRLIMHLLKIKLPWLYHSINGLRR